ncbi:MAG: tetratricopeptide repeat protein [Chloroflexota bacterium]
MKALSVYMPMDRRWALTEKLSLPAQTRGSALFADISGFTPLTAALLTELGDKRGPEELTHQLNMVYDSLISEVHRYSGCVISFSGDAITCWFDDDNGARAVTCALALQTAMMSFAEIKTPTGTVISLGMKAAVSAGVARRFVVGDPEIQIIDVLAGSTIDRMADAEHQAERGEVVVAPEVSAALEHNLIFGDARVDQDTNTTFSVVKRIIQPASETPWPPLEQSFSQADIRLWLLPAVWDRVQSGQGRFLAEIRPATTLFARFAGIDYDHDEAAGEKLDAYVRWAQTIITNYEGALLQVTLGDKGSYLYASFGAPIAHVDDSDRAVASALQLQAPPAHLAFVGQVQIGISQGRMRTGPYGGSTRRVYGVMGNEVNMSARLMTSAKRGQIIINEQVAKSVKVRFHLQSLGLLKVKGREELLTVFEVLGHRATNTQPDDDFFRNKLVGRQAELAEMKQILTSAKAGEDIILRLIGEAGIGKSHLVAEFGKNAKVEGWQVVVGTCQSTTQAMAYYPWRQIFERFFKGALEAQNVNYRIALTDQQIDQLRHQLVAYHPAWDVRLPLLGDLLGIPIPDTPTTAAFDPQLRQTALFSLVIDILQAESQQQPLLLILEDAHWLDEASQALIQTLARAWIQAPFVIMLVQRPLLENQQTLLFDLDDTVQTVSMELAELSPDDRDDLVAEVLSGEPSRLLLDVVSVEAEGNPFFIEEFVVTLLETQHLTKQADDYWDLSDEIKAKLQRINGLTRNEDGEVSLNPSFTLSASDLDLPDSVHGFVLARLDRLPESQKLTLKVASVIGRQFVCELLAGAHPVKQEDLKLQEQMQNLCEDAFIYWQQALPDLSYLFKHNVTRDVAYDMLLDSQQRDLHLAVAVVLERLDTDAVEQLAHHYYQAQIGKKALYYLEKAAQKAQKEYANETALHYYEQALLLEQRWTFQKGRIEILHILGRREEEAQALQDLEANPEAPEFDVSYRWGLYYETTADYTAAKQAMQQALRASQSENRTIDEAHCLAHLGLIARQPGDYEAAKAYYTQGLQAFHDIEKETDQAILARIDILNGLGTTSRQQGAFEEAQTYYQAALTLSRQANILSGEAEALNSLGVTAHYQRNFDDALAYYQEALTIRRTIGDKAGEGKSLYSLSFTHRDKGNYDHAQSALSDALTICQATGSRWDEVNIWNDMGILYQELGDLPKARLNLAQGLRLARLIGDENGEAYLLSNLGIVLRDQGDSERAEKVLNEGLALVQAQADTYAISYFHSHLAVLYLQTTEFEIALDQAKAALSLRQEANLELWTTADLMTLAATHLATNNVDEALDFAERGLKILDECGGEGPESPQRDYFTAYQVLTAIGKSDRAQKALESAYQLVHIRAEKLASPTLRESFLTNVPINRDIVKAYEASQMVSV